MGGYIKLHRRLMKRGWTDGNTARVFQHLLLAAKYEPSQYLGN